MANPDVPARARDMRGVALVMVLWILSILSILGAALAFQSRTQLVVTRQALTALQVDQVGRAALWLAAGALSPSAYPSPWRADGTPHDVTFHQYRLRIAVFDESGMISLWAASPELLRTWLAMHDVPPDRAKRLVDHLMRIRQPPVDSHTALPRGLATLSTSLSTLSGMKSFDGMTPQLYQALRDQATVVWHGAVPDMRFASPAMRQLIEQWASVESVPSRPVDENGSGMYRVICTVMQSDQALGTVRAVIRMLPQMDGEVRFDLVEWDAGS